jgi:hypothetical protein
MEVPETIDMLYCLKEVCSIYSAKPERVAKVRKQAVVVVISQVRLSVCDESWCFADHNRRFTASGHGDSDGAFPCPRRLHRPGHCDPLDESC